MENMNGKTIEVLICIIALLVIVALVSNCAATNIEDAKTFDISEYEYIIESERLYGDCYMTYVGDVSTKEKALSVAEKLLIETYGEYAMQTHRSLSVQYDEDADAWLISTLTRWQKEYFVLMERSSGNLLAIWAVNRW